LGEVVPDPVVAGGVGVDLLTAGVLFEAVPLFLPVFAHEKMTIIAIKMSSPTIQPV
jgi:hypothetical protein